MIAQKSEKRLAVDITRNLEATIPMDCQLLVGANNFDDCFATEPSDLFTLEAVPRTNSETTFLL